MKILNISLEKKLFDNGSAPQRRVIGYAELFDRFDLLVMAGKDYQCLEFENMVIWPTNSSSRLWYMHDAYYLAKKIIEKSGHEIVSAQDPFEMGFVGWRLAKKFKLKFQVQLHGDFFGSKYWRRESFLNRFRYYLGKFIVRRADGIRVVSQRVKKSLLDMGIAEEKISVVPIYSEVQNLKLKVQNDNAKLKDKFIFLTVGRLVAVKNIQMQIEVMQEIVKKYPQAELWIVGGGAEEASLKFKVKSFRPAGDHPKGEKLENNIKFFGWQDNLEEFYGQAGAFLLTSNYEGWGMAVVEAASFGLPIIMTAVGCAGELIKNGESGIVIPVGDKDALAREMSGLINDDDLCRRLGEGAKEVVGRLPGKEKNLNMYKEACQQVMI